MIVKDAEDRQHTEAATAASVYQSAHAPVHMFMLSVIISLVILISFRGNLM